MTTVPIDSVPIGLFLLDAAGGVIQCNTALGALLGQAPAALLGTPLEAAIFSEDRARFADALARASAQDGPVYEACRLQRDDDLSWVEMHLQAVRAAGRVTGLSGALIDATPCKEAEKRLLAREEHLRLLLDYSSDVLALTAPDEQVLYVSPKALMRHSGYTAEEYTKQLQYEIIHPDDLPGVLAQVEEWRTNPPEEAICVARCRGKSGEYRWMEGRTRPIFDAQGRIKYLVQVSRDVTDRVEVERALQERTEELAQVNAELARALRMKDEFLATMSHELRTPLTAIIGLSEALQLGVSGSLTDAQARMVSLVEESGRHLLSLINDILDLAKIEAGSMTLTQGPVAVAACCHAAWRLINEMATKKLQSVELEIDPTVTVIRADERRLKQLLVNLLSNAIKFTPERGRLDLRVEGDAAGGTVRFIVWDTGIGIAAADQARLFQPFVQLDARLARTHEGTGLGLSLVKRMAELHGGTVMLESAPGAGSRFTVTLPWISEQLPDASAEPLLPLPALQGAHVLLVEDHAVLADLLTQFLAELGYRVVWAGSGEAALARVREQMPDLILMDIQMPGMDGVEVTQRLRALPACAAIPIIALTALAMPGDLERCLEAGMDDYVSKPLTLPQVARTIARHLRRGQGVRDEV